MALPSPATGPTESGVMNDLAAANDESPQPLQEVEAQNHDSGYSSIASTPSKPDVQSDRSAIFFRPPSFPKFHRAKSNDKILFSDIEVDDDARQAYTRIQPHFERQLRDYILANPKRGETCYPLWIRLMMVGTSVDDADVHIVVFCKPKYKTVVRRFFEQEHVTELCNTSGPRSETFKLHVEGSAPRLRHAVVQVITDSSPHLPQTLCGTPISLQHPSGRTRNATLGGVIKLVDNRDEFRLYGISAGHALEELEAEDDEAAEHTFDDVDDDTDDEIEEPENGDHEDYGLCWLFDGDYRALSEFNDMSSRSWVFTKSKISGMSVQTPPVSSSGTAKRHDWALFDMSSYEPNKVPGGRGRNINMSTKTPGHTGSREVYLLSGSGPHGTHDACKKGVLSPSCGRIALGPSLELTDAYILMLSNTSSIHDGDSGSWIVDCQTMELYGHLVATGFFEEGIVVPMKDVFEDIKDQFSAISVTLPSDVDMLSSGYELLQIFGNGPPQSQNESIAAPDSGYQSLITTPKRDPWPNHMQRSEECDDDTTVSHTRVTVQYPERGRWRPKFQE